jgi:YbbR-like protein
MRDWFTNDIYWKGFSVLMALGIWLTVHKFSGEGAPPPGLLSVENTYTNVPVSVVSGSGDVHTVRVEPDAVTVAVSGSSDAMAAFDSDRIHAFVNLTGADVSQEMRWRVEVATPPRVTILSISPPTVTVIASK